MELELNVDTEGIINKERISPSKQRRERNIKVLGRDKMKAGVRSKKAGVTIGSYGEYMLEATVHT